MRNDAKYFDESSMSPDDYFNSGIIKIYKFSVSELPEEAAPADVGAANKDKESNEPSSSQHHSIYII